MNVFNFTKIPGRNEVIHCPTLDIAQKVLSYLDSKGCRWAGDHVSLLHDNFWSQNKEHTCYRVEGYDVRYDGIHGYLATGRKVLEVEGQMEPSNLYGQFVSTVGPDKELAAKLKSINTVSFSTEVKGIIEEVIKYLEGE